MVSADQLLQADVRMRQAKQRADRLFGNLAIVLSGDVLQLPPVDKNDIRKSLAGDIESNDDDVDCDTKTPKAMAERKAKRGETEQGLRIWKSVRRVVCLEVNVRAPGVLSRLQAEMRSGLLSDDMWDLYMSRVLQPNDERLIAQNSPFSKYPWHFIVHRHRIRVLRSLQNAREHCRKERKHLYVVQAHDEATRSSDKKKRRQK